MGWAKGKVIYTEWYIPTRKKKRGRDYLVVTGGLD